MRYGYFAEYRVSEKYFVLARKVEKVRMFPDIDFPTVLLLLGNSLQVRARVDDFTENTEIAEKYRGIIDSKA